jgi:predicted negative regulator of RcsB-dependent stress response
MAADENQPVERGERLRVGVTEAWAGSRGENNPAPFARVGTGENAVDDRRERLDAQHHPRSATERTLVGARAGFAGSDDIVHPDDGQPALDGAPDDRKADDGCEHLGEERNDVDVQHERVSFFARLFGSTWPQAPKTPFAAGTAALERRRFDEALAHFHTALASARSDPERALIYNKRALAYLGRGERAAAVAAFTDGLEEDARCVPVIVNVGNLLLEDGVFDDALAHYEAALRIDDSYAAGHLNLGIAYKRLGRRAEAVRAFRRAARLEAQRRGRRRAV